MDVHSVTVEQELPSFRNIARAAFALATGRVERARALLSGEQKLIAKDAEGKPLFALSGGTRMTVYTGKTPAQESSIPRGENRFRL